MAQKHVVVRSYLTQRVFFSLALPRHPFQTNLQSRQTDSLTFASLYASLDCAIVTGRGENKRIIVKAKVTDLEQVSEFEYRGATITESAASENEVKNRVGIGVSTLAEMNAIWRAKKLKVKGKISS